MQHYTNKLIICRNADDLIGLSFFHWPVFFPLALFRPVMAATAFRAWKYLPWWWNVLFVYAFSSFFLSRVGYAGLVIWIMLPIELMAVVCTGGCRSFLAKFRSLAKQNRPFLCWRKLIQICLQTVSYGNWWACARELVYVIKRGKNSCGLN